MCGKEPEAVRTVNGYGGPMGTGPSDCGVPPDLVGPGLSGGNDLVVDGDGNNPRRLEGNYGYGTGSGDDY
jgi:hypothetical protein